MVETRHGANTGVEDPKESSATGKENQPPAGSPPQQRNSSATTPKGLKRDRSEAEKELPTSASKKQQIDHNRNFAATTNALSEDQEVHGSSVTGKAASHASFQESGAGDAAQQHPTVRNVVKSESGELISKCFPPSGNYISGGSRDPTEGMETYTDSRGSDKPPLTIEDISFDYDRSQMRDPRATPGRKARPYYEKYDDIPVKLLEDLQKTRSVFKAERPKGRLTNAVKDDMINAESEKNPWASFYSIQQCYDKGREGSPTYDAAGFQLDYDKVCEWKRPKAYNKRRIVGGMSKAIEKGRSDEEQMFELFFTDPQEAKRSAKEYLQDQVSKDLGIGWQQIGPAQVKLWREKGFEPVKYAEWWKEPTEVERMRMSKMMHGASLRKEVWPPGMEPRPAENKNKKTKSKK